MTRADRIIEFIHRYIMIPEGDHVGKPIQLEPFQEKFIRDVYDNPAGTKRGILSTAKKNSKTTTIAILVIVHLVGPEAVQNSQVVSGAMSREQASLVFKLASKMIAFSPRLADLIKVISSTKTLIGLPMNVEYRASSAEAKTTQGISPIVAILDEVGQVVGPRSEFIEAVTTAQGAYDNALQLIISTQAASDSDLLSVWIDDAFSSKDPRIICHLYAADDGCDLMDEAQWYKANPALGKFRSIDDLRQQLTEASRMPSAEASARNLLLNQRVSTNNPAISRTAWKACEQKPYPIEECATLYAGLDLSSRTDLTAFVLYGYHEESKTWNAYPHFWTPHDGLLERAKRDRAPYDLWVSQGFLKTTPGSTINFDFVAHEMADICNDLPIAAIAYDRWRIDILRYEMQKMGVELPLKEWGQGFKDMSPAVDAIEAVILNGAFRHGAHPVLTMCAAQAIIQTDPSGNRKLDKSKSSGRIDGYVALAMAAGIAEREHEEQGDFNDFINAPLVL